MSVQLCTCVSLYVCVCACARVFVTHTLTHTNTDPRHTHRDREKGERRTGSERDWCFSACVHAVDVFLVQLSKGLWPYSARGWQKMFNVGPTL